MLHLKLDVKSSLFRYREDLYCYVSNININVFQGFQCVRFSQCDFCEHWIVLVYPILHFTIIQMPLHHTSFLFQIYLNTGLICTMLNYISIHKCPCVMLLLLYFLSYIYYYFNLQIPLHQFSVAFSVFDSISTLETIIWLINCVLCYIHVSYLIPFLLFLLTPRLSLVCK